MALRNEVCVWGGGVNFEVSKAQSLPLCILLRIRCEDSFFATAPAPCLHPLGLGHHDGLEPRLTLWNCKQACNWTLSLICLLPWSWLSLHSSSKWWCMASLNNRLEAVSQTNPFLPTPALVSVLSQQQKVKKKKEHLPKFFLNFLIRTKYLFSAYWMPICLGTRQTRTCP